MVSNHTLHRSKSRMEKASPLQKTSSKFQRKVNSYKARETKLLEKLTVHNIALIQVHKLISWAIENNRITKEECKKFIKRKKEIREEINSPQGVRGAHSPEAGKVGGSSPSEDINSFPKSELSEAKGCRRAFFPFGEKKPSWFCGHAFNGKPLLCDDCRKLEQGVIKE